MINIVLDANVAIDWYLPTAVGDAYSLPLKELAAASEVRFVVPEHFIYEVSRILVMRALHGDSLNPPKGSQWLQETMLSLEQAPIDHYVVGLNYVLLSQLAKTWNLSAPDVPYFHLARETDCAIATRDKAIIKACNLWNVHHWQPYATSGA